MNKEIKALIDREAEERFSLDIFKAFSDFELSAAKFEFKNGALFALSLFKWIKVSEELPEVMEEPYYINVRREGNIIETLYIEESTNCIDVLCRMNAIEWMPIPEGGNDE